MSEKVEDNAPVVPCKVVEEEQDLVFPSGLTNERHLTVLGVKLTFFLRIGWGFWPVEGSPGFVDASRNMLKIIKYRRWLLAQWHTHPQFLNQFSNQDNMTFKAFANAFHYDLLFPIESGIDGTATYCVRKVNKYDYIFKSHFRTFRLGRLFIFVGY